MLDTTLTLIMGRIVLHGECYAATAKKQVDVGTYSP